MSKTTLRSCASLGAVLVFLAAALLAVAAPRGQARPAGLSSQPWSVLGAGGGHASSASYSLDGTIGQPLAGFSASHNVSLQAGYWQSAETRVYVYIPLAIR